MQEDYYLLRPKTVRERWRDDHHDGDFQAKWKSASILEKKLDQ